MFDLAAGMVVCGFKRAFCQIKYLAYFAVFQFIEVAHTENHPLLRGERMQGGL